MRGLPICLVVALVIATLALAGCAPAAAPTPTAAPKAAAPTTAPKAAPTEAPKAAAPTAAPKAAEPTKPAAPAAQPTAAPAKALSWPEKGKSITFIVPFTAGGGADIAARLLAPLMEKDLGVPVSVVNKAGASTQIGSTELATAKPDGYTIGLTTFAGIFVTYMDPERKATYTRKDFAPIANFVSVDNELSVKPESPFKTTKDLVDAAKAAPEKLKIGTSGILGNTHLVPLRLESVSGAKFAYVHFTGGADVNTAALGGHIDVGSGSVIEVMSHYQGKTLRILGTTGRQQSRFMPDVKTFDSQGFAVTNTYSIGISAPAGTPKEIVDLMTKSIKKGTEDADLKQKLNASAMEPDYMDPAKYEAYWIECEGQIRPLVEGELKRQK